MVRMICFANSLKGQLRCVAGIDTDTGKWVRPLNPENHEGAIGNERLIGGIEPQVLDVLDIPIGDQAQDYGCQPENRILLPGRWEKIRTESPENVLRYIDKISPLLHTTNKKVTPAYFDGIPKEQWKSLQLIDAENLHVYKENDKWKCDFDYGGHSYKWLKITDPEILDYLDKGRRITDRCLLTVSLTSPYDDYCWKVVAGVIEMQCND